MPETTVAEKQPAIELLQSGPFSLRETSSIVTGELLDSIIEQNAMTPEQQLFLADTMQQSIEKRDRLGQFLARVEAEEEIIRNEEKRLAARRRNFERIRETLVAFLKLQLENWGVLKVEGREFTFAIRKNPPKVIIDKEEDIPAEFITYNPVIDKASIKDRLQDGQEVSGAHLEQGTRLEIR